MYLNCCVCNDEDLGIWWEREYDVHYYDIVKLLLKIDIFNPSYGGTYGLRMASINGQYKIIKLLLKDDRVDSSFGDNFAVVYASLNGHYKIVKLLLRDNRIDSSVCDESSNHIIRWVNKHGNYEVEKLLY